MTFLIRTPCTRHIERRYVLDLVLTRWWGVDWHHRPEERTDVRIELADDSSRGVILPDVLFSVPAEEWLTTSSLPGAGQPWRPVGAVDHDVFEPAERLPIVYGSSPSEDGRLLDWDGEDARVHVDVFGTAFFMLTRYEELVGSARDVHDRFPAEQSTAAREGFLRLPIVDAYLELLWMACARVWPRLRRRPRRYAVALTHDVDEPLSTLGRGPAQHARQLAGDVVRRRDPVLMGRRLRALAAARRDDHTADPNNTFDFLMDVSERHGLCSAFYFLGHRTDRIGAATVDLLGHPWVRELIAHVHGRGHEVGFHAAYDTHLDPDRTAHEFDRLRVIAQRLGVEQDRWGGRQHYLQWSNPTTWRNWAAAGLAYDCTLAYSHSVGFRTGTCRDYPVFDLIERRTLGLVETPFQVMDVTLFGHMSLTPEDAWEATLRIAGECRRFGGTLGLLWHNDSVLRTGREKRWYSSLIETVVSV